MNLSIARISALLTAVAVCLATTAMPATPVAGTQIPGTRVFMNIPKGFVIATSFSGIRHPDEEAAISVSEIPSSYLDFSKRYTTSNLNQPGTRLLRRERMDKEGLSGHLLVVQQRSRRRSFERWILITGDTSESVVITGFFPVDRARKFRSVIEHALTTSFWDSAKVLDHFSGLGFRLDDVPNLRVASRLDNNLIFTATGQLPDRYYTGALLFVNYRPYAKGTKISTQFAREQFNKISLLSMHSIDNIQSNRLRGLDTITIEGSGNHAHLGYAIAAIQVVTMTDTGALIAQGFTTFEKRDNDFEIFKTTIGSFRVTDN